MRGGLGQRARQLAQRVERVEQVRGRQNRLPHHACADDVAGKLARALLLCYRAHSLQGQGALYHALDSAAEFCARVMHVAPVAESTLPLAYNRVECVSRACHVTLLVRRLRCLGGAPSRKGQTEHAVRCKASRSEGEHQPVPGVRE